MTNKIKHTNLKGSKVHLFNKDKLKLLTKTPAEKVMEVILVLKPGNPSEKIDELNNSVAKRKASFKKRYKVSAKVIEAIHKFSLNFDLNLDKVIKDVGIVYISGTVTALEKAFKVELHQYQYHEEIARFKQEVTGYQGDCSIPKPLVNIVSGIIGLSHIPLLHHTVANKSEDFFSAAKGMKTDWFTDYYNYPKSYKGKDQCVGIISCGGGISMKEIHSYCLEMNLKKVPHIEFVSVGGENNDPGKSFGYDLEMATDCLIALTAAPEASFKVYCTKNSIKGFCDAVLKVTKDSKYGPKVISYSWGANESDYSIDEIKGVNRILKYAALRHNITILCSSGDKGSTNDFESSSDSPLVVQFPASSPWVTSCGGTMIQINKKGLPINEKVWNSPTNLYDILIQNATGGGFSSSIAMPNYQKEMIESENLPYPVNFRGIPDISAHADLSPAGIAYWVSVDGQYWLSGGTSAVAPFLAALIARFNQALGKPIGFLNPHLYAMRKTAAIKAITEGNNAMANGPNKYYAGESWNPCTGLGVPDGKAMLAYFRKHQNKSSK